MNFKVIDNLWRLHREYIDEYRDQPDVLFVNIDEFLEVFLKGDMCEFFKVNPNNMFNYIMTYEFMGWKLIPIDTHDFTYMFYYSEILDDFVSRKNMPLRENYIQSIYVMPTFSFSDDDYADICVTQKDMIMYKDAINVYSRMYKQL